MGFSTRFQLTKKWQMTLLLYLYNMFRRSHICSLQNPPKPTCSHLNSHSCGVGLVQDLRTGKNPILNSLHIKRDQPSTKTTYHDMKPCSATLSMKLDVQERNFTYERKFQSLSIEPWPPICLWLIHPIAVELDQYRAFEAMNVIPTSKNNLQTPH